MCAEHIQLPLAAQPTWHVAQVNTCSSMCMSGVDVAYFYVIFYGVRYASWKCHPSCIQDMVLLGDCMLSVSHAGLSVNHPGGVTRLIIKQEEEVGRATNALGLSGWVMWGNGASLLKVLLPDVMFPERLPLCPCAAAAFVSIGCCSGTRLLLMHSHCCNIVSAALNPSLYQPPPAVSYPLLYEIYHCIEPPLYQSTGSLAGVSVAELCS